MIMIDLDHFETFNNDYGYKEGDRCLARFARIVSQSTRQYLDFPAYYGGKEFAVLLSNIDLDSVQASAERSFRTMSNRMRGEGP